ncbi:retrotransposon gag domain, retroviral aspartyl protease [Tanacetum coccineum]
MVTTRNTTSHNEQLNHNDTSSPLQNPDNLAQQLSSIASKLNALDALAADVAVLKAQAGPNGPNRGKSVTLGSRHRDEDSESTDWYRNSTRRPFTKMEFPKFQGGDPRGWILKAEKYFRYYETLDESKVEIASMYIEGDALDLFAWISADHNHLYWEELRKSRPTSNPRTSNSFNDNKPSSYSTSSHDPSKLSATYPNASSSAQSQNWESERQNLRDKGLYFRCKEKFALGHRCKLATFLLLEISNDNEQLEDREVEVNENEYEEGINQQDMAEISFHAILRKTSGTTMKVEGTLEGRKVLTLVDSGSTHNFISALLMKQLGLKKYKLQGVPLVVKTDASFQSYSKLPDATLDSSRPRVKVKENQGVDALSRRPQHRAGFLLALICKFAEISEPRLCPSLLNPVTLKGISNLCLDPPILWSSLKVSRSIVVPLIVLFRPPFLFVWRLCEFFSLWRPDLLRLVWWFSPLTEMAMVVALLLQFDIFFLLQIASMVAFKKTQVLLGEFPGSHIDHTVGKF